MKLPSAIITKIEPPAGVGKRTFENVVSAAVMAYQLHNRNPKNRGKAGTRTLPSIEDIAEYCHTPKNTINKVVASDAFLYAMRGRGIYWSAADALSPEQVYCIGIMTDPSSKLDMAGKLKRAGISMHTYRMWLKQPLFARAIKQIGEDMLNEHVADINTAVVRSAVDGNMKAVEIYNQMTGRYDPGKQQVTDLQMMVGQLLDIIFRYVTDTNTLAKINNDFSKVMTGEIVEAELVVDDGTTEYPAGASGAVPLPMDNEQDAPSVADDSSVAEEDEDIPPGFFDYQVEGFEL